MLIVAGELVENAVDHGEPSALGAIQFSWRLHGARVEVCVVDSTSGPGFSHEARDIFDLDSARGRGLMMVDVISERWAVEQDPTSGTTAVSAVLSVG
ncbi:ATP-binding protein [Nocardioides sp. ChNu-99]|nr:ATP-binding protein [Nocardioides sp. ChNu-99]